MEDPERLPRFASPVADFSAAGQHRLSASSGLLESVFVAEVALSPRQAHSGAG